MGKDSHVIELFLKVFTDVGEIPVDEIDDATFEKFAKKRFLWI